ncbi:unnamed protein product, partial [Symbiodinium sp. KB8]
MSDSIHQKAPQKEQDLVLPVVLPNGAAKESPGLDVLPLLRPAWKRMPLWRTLDCPGLRPAVEDDAAMDETRMNEKITKGQEHSSCAPAQDEWKALRAGGSELCSETAACRERQNNSHMSWLPFQRLSFEIYVTEIRERSAVVFPCERGTRVAEFEVIDFDYAVIAAGSRYVGKSQWKVAGDDEAQHSLQGRRQGLTALRQRLEQRAARGEPAVLLGAGLVGVELAAELAHFLPTLPVILADRCSRPLPTLPVDAQ